MRLGLLLVPLLAHAASLLDLALAVCGCALCDVTSVLLDVAYPVIAYGNASAGVFDWLGAARDFLPSPVVLASTQSINCSDSLALLVNGTDVVAQFAWTQYSPAACLANVSAAAGNGDYAFVAAVHSDNASVVLSHLPLGLPVSAAATVAPRSIALVEPLRADCALPGSFDYWCVGRVSKKH